MTQAIFPKYQLGTSHYYKTEDLNVFANYSFSPRKEFKEDESYINFRDGNGNVLSRWETDFERITRSNAHSANLMLDYFLNDNNILNFSSNFTLSPNQTFDNEVLTRVYTGNSEVANLITNSELEEDMANAALDLEYKHLLEKPGAQISAKVHFTRYDQDRDQVIATTIDELTVPDQERQFKTVAQQDIDILTGQLDYITPIGSTSFEAGLKASLIDSESGIDYFQIDPATGEQNYDQQQSDNFLYDENIYAAYIFSCKRLG